MMGKKGKLEFDGEKMKGIVDIEKGLAKVSKDLLDVFNTKKNQKKAVESVIGDKGGIIVNYEYNDKAGKGENQAEKLSVVLKAKKAEVVFLK